MYVYWTIVTYQHYLGYAYAMQVAIILHCLLEPELCSPQHQTIFNAKYSLAVEYTCNRNFYFQSKSEDSLNAEFDKKMNSF